MTTLLTYIISWSAELLFFHWVNHTIFQSSWILTVGMAAGFNIIGMIEAMNDTEKPVTNALVTIIIGLTAICQVLAWIGAVTLPIF